MIYVDLLVRSACLVLLLLLVINLLRSGIANKQTVLLLLSCISVAGLVLGLTPEPLRLPHTAYRLVRLLDVPHLVLIWLFGLSLFQSQFKIKTFHVVAGTLYCLPILWVRLAQFGVLDDAQASLVMLSNAFTVVLIGHLLHSVIGGRLDDLSETRRTARLHFVVLISIIAFAISASEMIVVNIYQDRTLISTIKTAALFPAIMWTCLWLLRFDSQAFEFTPIAQPTDNWRPGEVLLLERLNDELRVNRAYLEAGLKISELSRRLAVSETKLRAFMNRRLGYAHFSTFINSYRIEAVKKDFENPDYADHPILTIAMNNGFASLSPFNRAFVKTVGVTPSEYRKSLANQTTDKESTSIFQKSTSHSPR